MPLPRNEAFDQGFAMLDGIDSPRSGDSADLVAKAKAAGDGPVNFDAPEAFQYSPGDKPSAWEDLAKDPVIANASNADQLRAFTNHTKRVDAWMRSQEGYTPADRATATEAIRARRAQISGEKPLTEKAGEVAGAVVDSLKASFGGAAFAGASILREEDRENFYSLFDAQADKARDYVTNQILDREVPEANEEQFNALVDEGFTPITDGSKRIGQFIDRREKLDTALSGFKDDLDNGNFPGDPEGFQNWVKEKQSVIISEAQRFNGDSDSYEADSTRRFEADLDLVNALSDYTATRDDAAFNRLTQQMVRSNDRQKADSQFDTTFDEAEGLLGGLREGNRAQTGSDHDVRMIAEAGTDPSELASTALSMILTGGTAKAIGAAGRGAKAATVGSNVVLDTAMEAATEAFQSKVDNPNVSAKEAAAQGALVGLAFQLTGAALGGVKLGARRIMDGPGSGPEVTATESPVSPTDPVSTDPVAADPVEEAAPAPQPEPAVKSKFNDGLIETTADTELEADSEIEATAEVVEDSPVTVEPVTVEPDQTGLSVEPDPVESRPTETIETVAEVDDDYVPFPEDETTSRPIAEAEGNTFAIDRNDVAEEQLSQKDFEALEQYSKLPAAERDQFITDEKPSDAVLESALSRFPDDAAIHSELERRGNEDLARETQEFQESKTFTLDEAIRHIGGLKTPRVARESGETVAGEFEEAQKESGRRVIGRFTNTGNEYDVGVKKLRELGFDFESVEDLKDAIIENDRGNIIRSRGVTDSYDGQNLFESKANEPIDPETQGLETFVKEKLAGDSRFTPDEVSAVRVLGGREQSELARDRPEIRAAEKLAELFGRKVVVIENLPANGFVNTTNSTEIFLDANPTRSAFLVAGHEILHSMKVSDPDLYQEVKDAVSADVEAFVAENRPELLDSSPDLQSEEFIADLFSDVISDSAFWDRLSDSDPSLFERFAKYVTDFLEKIRQQILEGRIDAAEYLSNAAETRTVIETATMEFRRREQMRTDGIIPDDRTGENRLEVRGMDADYMKAVESGDMEAVQRMVDQAAKDAGYSTLATHKTRSQFTQFSNDHSGGAGFYFDTSGTNEFSGPVEMRVYLSAKSGIDKKRAFEEFPGHGGNPRRQTIQQMQRAGLDHWYTDSGEVAVFESNQIKSADPVTYDDAGNVIPLSQRFDSTSNDIRFEPRERATKKNQQVFGQETGRADEIQSISELKEAVQKAVFNGDLDVSPENTLEALVLIGEIEAGRINAVAATGLDGANQQVKAELFRYATKLAASGDSAMLSKIEKFGNDFFHRESTIAGRVLNALGQEVSALQGILQEKIKVKKEKVRKLKPGSKLDELIEAIETEIDGVSIEDLSAEEIAKIIKSIKKGGRKPVKSRRAVRRALVHKDLASEVDSLTDLVDGFFESENVFADLKAASPLEKKAALDVIVDSQIKTGRRPREKFLSALGELGLSDEKAGQIFDKIESIREKNEGLRKKSPRKKHVKTPAEELADAADAEATRIDGLNTRVQKISDRLNEGKRKAEKSEDPLRDLINAQRGESKLGESAFIKALGALGVRDVEAQALFDAIENDRNVRKGKADAKTKTASADALLKRVKKITDRLNAGAETKTNQPDQLRLLVNGQLSKTPLSQAEFLAGLKKLGVPEAESQSLYDALSNERVKRAEIAQLKKEAKAAEGATREQEQANALIETIAQSQSDTQDNRPGKKPVNLVREMFQSLLDFGPVMSRARFVEELGILGVDADSANTLHALAARERRNRESIRKTKSAQKQLEARERKLQSVSDRSIPFLIKELLANPLLKIVGTSERQRMASKLFQERAGLAPTDALAAAKQFDHIFVEKLSAARIKAAERIAKTRAPWAKIIEEQAKGRRTNPTIFDRVRRAIRSGAMDPRINVSDEVAKLNGWTDFTVAEVERLAILDEKLDDPGLTPFETTRYRTQMVKIVNQSSADPDLKRAISSYYLANIFSGVKTQLLQFSVINNIILRVGLIDPVAGVLGDTTKSSEASVAGWLDSVGGVIDHMRKGIQDGYLTLRTGQNRALIEKEAMDAVDDLQKVHDKAVKILNNPTASKVRKAKAAVGLIGSFARWTFRIMSALDSSIQGFIKSYDSQIVANSRAFRAGVTPSQMREIRNEVMRLSTGFQSEGAGKGFTGNDLQVFVNDKITMGIFDALEGKGIDLAGVMDMAATEAAIETGVKDIEVGVSVLPGQLAKAFQDFSNKAGLIGKLAVPVVRTPYNVFHRSAWMSPYGLVRILGTGIKTKGFKEWGDTQYPISLSNPRQLLLRSAESIVGTAMFSVIGGMFLANREREEEEKWFRINLSGPSMANPIEAKSWLATGRKPFSIQFRFGKTDRWESMGFRRGGFEALNFVATLIGAAEQAEYNRTARAFEGEGQKYLATLMLEMTGESMFFLRGVSRGPGLSEESLAREAGFRASGMIPFSSLLKTVDKFSNYKDYDGWKQAFSMQMPIVPAFNGNERLNALGDPLGGGIRDKGYDIQAKLGLPFGYAIAGGREEELYLLMFEKKHFPSVESRKQIGDVTLQEYRNYVSKRGKRIKSQMKSNQSRLIKMTPEDFKKEVSKYQSKATKETKKAMGL